jgi:hypothetical protein
MFLKTFLKDLQVGGLFVLMLLLTPIVLFSQGNQDLVSITGVGDMMIGTNYPSKAYLPPDGGSGIFKHVAEHLQEADVTFGNLEGTMFDGEGEPKKCRDSTKCYLFRTPANYVRHYYDAGFDLISLANNHSGDFGATGRNRTKAGLKNAGLLFAGLEGTDETAVFEKNGVKFGFCAFAPNSGTCDIRDISRAKAIVASLEKTCDIVIVSFHGGAEGADHQHVPKKTEYFLEEDRGDVYKFSHAVIDAGADVVFGHGPHVTRGVELYKDRFIAYSMGNFATYSRISLQGQAGLAPIIKLFTDEKGAFVKGEIISTYQVKGSGPKLDPQKRVLAKIKELTADDFSGGGLNISAEGFMTKK